MAIAAVLMMATPKTSATAATAACDLAVLTDATIGNLPGGPSCRNATGYSFFVLTAPPLPEQLAAGMCDNLDCQRKIRGLRGALVTMGLKECDVNGLGLSADVLAPIDAYCRTRSRNRNVGTSTHSGAGQEEAGVLEPETPATTRPGVSVVGAMPPSPSLTPTVAPPARTPSSSAPGLAPPINSVNKSAPSTSSGLGTGAIVAIVLGIALVLAVVGFVLVKRRHHRRRELHAKHDARDDEDEEMYATCMTPAGSGEGGVALARDGQSTWSNGAAVAAATADMETFSTELVTILNSPILTGLRVPAADVVYLRMIGKGEYGEVFLGLLKAEEVAVKRLQREHQVSVPHLERFVAEVELIASLHHEHIVRVLGVAWSSPRDFCAVAEYMPNGDLRTVLYQFKKEKRATGFYGIKIKMALEIAQALKYLHDRGLLHRDLTSAHVLVSSDYDAKLGHLGMSRERETMYAVTRRSWLAPEELAAQGTDEKSDVFYVGVLLAELDTHRPPHGATPEQLQSSDIRQLTSCMGPVLTFSEGADPEVVALAKDCVAQEPEQRPSAAELVLRLEIIAHRLNNSLQPTATSQL